MASLVLSACAGIRHPPSYTEIISVEVPEDRDPDEISPQEKAVRAALAFSDGDRRMLSASGEVSLLVGAAAEMPWQDERVDELLAAAEQLAPDSSLVLSTWIDHQLVSGFDQPVEEESDAEMRLRLRRLHESMPNNSLPLYVSAYGKLRLGDTDAALQAMRVGRQQAIFDSGSRQRFAAIVEAAEAAGYSPFTARYHAMGLFVPTGTYSALARLCVELIAGAKSHDGRVECILLGHAIETSSWNTLERVVGLSLQATAWEDVEGPEGDAARKAIGGRWLALKNRDELPSLRELSEETWLEYFRIFAMTGEDAAISYAASAAPSR